jgi:hypothetical protein
LTVPLNVQKQRFVNNFFEQKVNKYLYFIFRELCISWEQLQKEFEGVLAEQAKEKLERQHRESLNHEREVRQQREKTMSDLQRHRQSLELLLAEESQR